MNSTELEIGFINDLSTSADFHTLANDEEIIIMAITSTGLKLNTDKSEIIMNLSTLDSLRIFRGFIRVPKDNMLLPGLPI